MKNNGGRRTLRVRLRSPASIIAAAVVASWRARSRSAARGRGSGRGRRRVVTVSVRIQRRWHRGIKGLRWLGRWRRHWQRSLLRVRARSSTHPAAPVHIRLCMCVRIAVRGRHSGRRRVAIRHRGDWRSAHSHGRAAGARGATASRALVAIVPTRLSVPLAPAVPLAIALSITIIVAVTVAITVRVGATVALGGPRQLATVLRGRDSPRR